MITLPIAAPPAPAAQLPAAGDDITRVGQARWWVVNSSGGKDSMTSLRQVVLLADQVGYPRSRIVVAHADLGRMEWPGAKELAEEHAAHYGLRFEVERYRDEHGSELDLLQLIRRRGMWPSKPIRFCTSFMKRDPLKRLFTRLAREHGSYCTIINVMGMRAEESDERAGLKVFGRYTKPSSRAKAVYNWLPIHGWTARQVWADIHASKVRYHWAYDLGMPRLSCKFCIFAPRDALLIAGREDPDLLRKYVALEEEMGHTFRHKFSLKSVLEAVEAGDEPGQVNDWEM